MAESVRRPVDLPPSWLDALASEFDQPYMAALRSFLLEEKRLGPVYPPSREIFAAFHAAPLERVRVVVLGQDPYHGAGQAHGLCFSVRHGVPPPPSLVNIFKELSSDLDLPRPLHGDLTPWARQGVLLLNSVLTVRAGQPQSHAGHGWEVFTDRVVQVLAEKKKNLVFVLWGSPAQKKAALVDPSRHLLLKAPHPSPLSAHRGFLGSRPFSKINAHLRSLGDEPIDWNLPEAYDPERVIPESPRA